MASATTAVIVFSAARGLLRGFEPISDNAITELRARDVLTSNHPLLGTWSSASVSAGRDVNHPGPLLFDVFAVPVRLLGERAGLALGAAGINVAAVWGAVLAARRLGGSSTALAAAMAAALLSWTLGSEVLYDPWQPNVLVLPFFAFLVLVWAMFSGQWWALPVGVAVGSLLAQAHLSYLFIVPTLLAAGLVALWWRERPAPISVRRRPLLLAGGIGLVLWAQPLWEQLSGAGDGNIARLVSSTGTPAGIRTGLRLAVRQLGAVLAVPPAWARPGYDTAVPFMPWKDTTTGRTLDLHAVASLPSALTGLAVLATLLGVALIAARRSGDRVIAAGVAVIGVGVVMALFTAAITPIDVLGVVSHKVRWMWSLGAFVGTVLLAAVLRTLAARGSVRPARLLTAGVTAAALVLVVLTLPTSGRVLQPAAWPVVRALRDQLGPLEGVGTVLVDPEGIPILFEPFTMPLMAELAKRGIPFVVASPHLARHVGEGRLFEGHADVRVFVRVGDDALTTPPGATRIAFVDAHELGFPVGVFSEPYRAGDAGT